MNKHLNNIFALPALLFLLCLNCAAGTPARHQLHVTVTCDGLSTPGAGVRVVRYPVTIREQQPVYETVASGVTDRNGCLDVEFSVSESSLAVMAEKKGYALKGIVLRLFPSGSLPDNVHIRLTRPAIVVTALVTSAGCAMPTNFLASLFDRKCELPVLFSKTIKNNQITFPPVDGGLRDLRVWVEGEGTVRSYSDVVTIGNPCSVTLVPGLELHGSIRCSDNRPIANFTIDARLRKSNKRERTTGEWLQRIFPDAGGRYKSKALLPDEYTLEFCCDGCCSITTNINIGADDCRLDIVLDPIEYIAVRGRVVYDHSGCPAADIPVSCFTAPRSRVSSLIKRVTHTDTGGFFTVRIPVSSSVCGTLVAGAPGFARVTRHVYREDKEAVVALRLKRTGVVKGTVRAPGNIPVPGMNVALVPMSTKPLDRLRFYRNRDARYRECTYNYNALTDAAGEYTVSNVAAPAAYCIEARALYFHERYVMSVQWPERPSPETPLVQVAPGQTTRCDLNVKPRPILAIKAYDTDGNALSKYSVDVGLTSSRASGTEWRIISLPDNERRIEMPITAVAGGAVGSTNVSLLRWPHTNFVEVTIAPEAPFLTGILFMQDGSAAVGSIVKAIIHGSITTHPANECGKVRTFETPRYAERVSTTDANGRFSFYGVKLSDSDEVYVYSSLDRGRIRVSTSFYGRVSDVVLRASGTHPFKSRAREEHLRSLGGIRGRVVNQDGCPLAACIRSGRPLRSRWHGKQDRFYTDPANGYFYACDVEPGRLDLVAATRWENISIGSVDVRTSKTVTVPDIVITTPPMVNVALSFVLPDCTVVPNINVWQSQHYAFRDPDCRTSIYRDHLVGLTGDRASLLVCLDQGVHNGWFLMKDGRKYIAEPFTATQTVRHVRVKMYPYNTNILCAMRLNGSEFSGRKYRLKHLGTSSTRTLESRECRLTFDGPAGSYLISHQRSNLFTVVHLQGGRTNAVDFHTGDIVLRVPAGTLLCLTAVLQLHGEELTIIDKDREFSRVPRSRRRMIDIAPSGASRRAVLLAHLPVGKYRIKAAYSTEVDRVGLDITTCVAARQTKTIHFDIETNGVPRAVVAQDMKMH